MGLVGVNTPIVENLNFLCFPYKYVAHNESLIFS